MPLPTSAVRPTPSSNSSEGELPPKPSRLGWGTRILGSPHWMVLIAFAVRVAWIALAHTYRIRTTEHNFGCGWEIVRIAFSLANGM